jgi:hypothetical protein
MDKAQAITSGANLVSASSGEKRARDTATLTAATGTPRGFRTGAAIDKSP